VWLPLVTPFRDGALDEVALAALVRHYAATPIDGLILAATTGEGLTLDADELERLVEIAAEAAAGALPLYLGLCGSDTRRLLKTLAQTRRWAVDGYLVACPYYTRPSQEGLRLHFTALAERIDKPIVIYNIPYRTGVNMTNETLLRLAELDAIAGVKDCCADAAQSFELIRDRPPGFAVLTGEDAQFFSAVAQGAMAASSPRRMSRPIASSRSATRSSPGVGRRRSSAGASLRRSCACSSPSPTRRRSSTGSGARACCARRSCACR
jgi:4-hydroxy-tetrahydrodipicolinate synthase